MNKIAAASGAAAGWVANDFLGGGTFKLLLVGVIAAVVANAVNKDKEHAT